MNRVDLLDSSLVVTTPSVLKGTMSPEVSVITGAESPRTVRSEDIVKS